MKQKEYPIDIFQRPVRDVKGIPSHPERGVTDFPYLGDAIFLSRNFKAATYSVGVVPIMILTTPFTHPFTFLNHGYPVVRIGSSSEGAIVSGFPLLLGEYVNYVVEENSEVWAVLEAGQQGKGLISVLEL